MRKFLRGEVNVCNVDCDGDHFTAYTYVKTDENCTLQTYVYFISIELQKSFKKK